jgi:hypothetical protein
MNIAFVYPHHAARMIGLERLMSCAAGFVWSGPNYVLHKGDLRIHLMLESDMPHRAAGMELSIVLMNPEFGRPTPEWLCRLRER